ncbi:Rgp1-domain-containing protein [Mrakia frigida]|uniref:Rgp1-domain-containing protein n=1 Tax=Mrakia frigida TaxID=29902 RepID=UPI003FCC1467
MVFSIPSLPSFASLSGSSYLHPHHAHQPDPPKLHISVTPLHPSTFAGEVFQAKISFRISHPEPPSTEPTPPPPHPQTRSTSNLAQAHSPDRNSREPISETPGRAFAPSHRTVQSLSVRGMDGVGRVPQTAGPILETSISSPGQQPPLGYSSLMSLEKHGSQEIPPRRGQIGKQPRPKLALLGRRGSKPGSHSRQRSISGSDLPMLGERRESEAVAEPGVEEGKGKGRAVPPGLGRSLSISAMPNGVETFSPLRGEALINGHGNKPEEIDSPNRTPTRPTASSLSSLPSRDTPPSIPASHPHARKPSYMPSSSFASSSSSPLPESGGFPRIVSPRSGSSSPSSGPNFGLSSILESPIGLGINSGHSHPPKSKLEDSYTQELDLPSEEPAEYDDPSTPLASRPTRPANSIGLGRPQSFHNSHSSAPPPPPIETSPQGLIITWSYVHLVSTLTPSPQYLPPESLLPLRHTLLQSSLVGTGSFPSPPTPQSQGWFSLPPPPRHSRAPSLTSSLFGIARGVVWGRGGESSLEGERRRKWEESVREVPVLETLKSVMGVGIELGGKDGKETLDFVYSLPIPPNLPPTFQGKALKISYTLIIGVEVEYPVLPLRPGVDDFGIPRKPLRKSKVLKIPVRIWGGVDATTTKQGYDLMQPIIQRKEEAELEELDPQLAKKLVAAEELEKEEHDRTPLPSTASSFDSYALHLLSTLPPPAPPPLPPLPESASPPTTPTNTPTNVGTPKSHKHTRSQALSPLSHSVLLPEVLLVGAEGKPSRRPSLAVRLHGGTMGLSGGIGPDEDGEGCEEVLEGLLRGSQKASYDIEKDGQVVAVFTLVKSAYRLGETVLGVLNFNQGETSRRVLKCSALLQTHEIIPSSLQSPATLSASPNLLNKPLKKTHADHHSSLTLHTTRLPFSLDIPSPGTAGGAGIAPSFVLRAGEGEDIKAGGVEWKIRLSFLVSVPPKQHHHRSKSGEGGGDGAAAVMPVAGVAVRPTHLVPSWKNPSLDPRHVGFEPASSIAPVLPSSGGGMVEGRGGRVETREKRDAGGGWWKEMRTEVVECDVPISVFPPSKLGVGKVDGVEMEGGVTWLEM